MRGGIRVRSWFFGLLALITMALTGLAAAGIFLLVVEFSYPERTFRFAHLPSLPPPENPEGQEVMDFELEDLAGETLRLADCRGVMPVVIEFGSLT